MRKIQLHGIYGKGKYALVDDDLYEKFNAYRWVGQKSRSGNIYAKRTEYLGVKNGKSITRVVMLHREIMNSSSKIHIDHINGDSLDNRKENLRYCTIAQNSRNRGKQKNNSSGYKGVSRMLGRNKEVCGWRAEIQYSGKKIKLGSFKSKEEAYKKYCEYSKKLYKNYSYQSL